MFMKLMRIVNLRLPTYSTQKIISSNGSCLYINKLFSTIPISNPPTYFFIKE